MTGWEYLVNRDIVTALVLSRLPVNGTSTSAYLSRTVHP